MDLVDQRVVREVVALARAAVRHAQEALGDERRERALDERPQVLVHRVHLQDDDPVLDEELVEQVHRADAGDVARAEHQRHAALAVGAGLVGLGHRAGQRLGRHARLHPDRLAEARVEDPVVERAGEDVDDQLAVGAMVDAVGAEARAAAGLDVAERGREQADVAEDGDRAAEPLLGGVGAAERQALGLAARADRAGGGLEGAGGAGTEELDPAAGRKRGPAAAVVRQRLDGAVELRRRGGFHSRCPERLGRASRRCLRAASRQGDASTVGAGRGSQERGTVIMKKRLAFAVLAAAVLAVTATFADEGMWRIDQLPLARIQKEYGVTLTPADLARVQGAVVRISSGGTGTFASANGLILTNHHVALDCIRTATLAEQGKGKAEDLIDQGFTAASPAGELSCKRFRAEVETSATDVTAELNAAVEAGHGRGRDPAGPLREAVGPRARVPAEDGRRLQLRGRRLQQRRPLAADRVRRVPGHPSRLRAREAARLLRRRRDELPLPALRVRHLDPARLREPGRPSHRLRARERAGEDEPTTCRCPSPA